MRVVTKLLLVVLVMWSTCCAAQTPPAQIEHDPIRVSAMLQTMLPTGVTLGQVTVAANSVTANGNVTSTPLLSQFMRSISGTTEFQRVELQKVEPSSTGNQFTISFQIVCANDAKTGICAPAKSKSLAIHKCIINGTVSFQATPCPE